MYSKTTHFIKITVIPAFLPEQSDPLEHHYVWAYTIRMENIGGETSQLKNRYWHITDANGAVQEVHGPGVVGEFPTLQPGEHYQYTSGAALKTPSGLMVGHYEMVTESGQPFLVDIPAFSLDSPDQIMRPN
ncbi:MAG: Co2+/Mg2+ efflux protein ApaG [Rickettsiales bacterium]|nr:Co2+/Mg2+ efflux protein ApaG [Rickettsiales bacterium]